MNMENLTPAMTKAIETGGTKNAVIGNALVKRGIFEKTEAGTFPYMPTAEFLHWESSLNASPHVVDVIDPVEEKNYADAIEKEENESPTSEAWEIENMRQMDEAEEIRSLRAEFEDADDDRRAEIQVRLMQLGTVVYPPGSAQYEKYTEEVHAALIEFAEADTKDLAAKLDEMVPPVIVRDPKETRYAHVSRWTDENLDVKRGILEGRLRRRTLLRSDRLQAERHLTTVKTELQSRGLL